MTETEFKPRAVYSFLFLLFKLVSLLPPRNIPVMPSLLCSIPDGCSLCSRAATKELPSLVIWESPSPLVNSHPKALYLTSVDIGNLVSEPSWDFVRTWVVSGPPLTPCRHFILDPLLFANLFAITSTAFSKSCVIQGYSCLLGS